MLSEIELLALIWGRWCLTQEEYDTDIPNSSSAVVLLNQVGQLLQAHGLLDVGPDTGPVWTPEGKELRRKAMEKFSRR